MSNVEKAKERLLNSSLTCVLYKGEKYYTSGERGVSPMLSWLSDGTELIGFSVADKVVGKAAAMLFVCAGVTEVFDVVMSRAAADFLDSRGVRYSYEKMTEKIINRKGDGVCPMELVVADIDDETLGKAAIEKRYNELKNERK